MRYIQVTEEQKLILSNQALPEFGESQLLIKVSAIGVNRADLLQRAGKYPPPKGESDTLGLEVCGEVVAKGSEVSSIALGDSVMALLAGGGYSEYVCVEASHVIKRPSGFDNVMGAGFIETFITAYQSLCLIGQLKKGQRVLIHAGASGVGTSAIQLAMALDCHVTITASNDDKCQACLALGADVAINYQDHDFLTYCKDQKLSFDVIVDVVGGDYIAKNVELARLDGTIVILAMLGGRYLNNIDLAKVLAKRVTIVGSTLRNRDKDYKTALINAFNQDFEQLLNESNQPLKPLIEAVFPWQKADNAHQLLASNQTIGKVVLTVD